jgi:pimeloyl-ACP methyl ester carboxylesterase
MAAARPDARDRVGYLVVFGPYFDLREVLRHMTTGGRSGEPAMPGGPPLRAGKWIFLRQNPDLLGLAVYEAEAAEIARRKLIDENASLVPFRTRLSSPARRVLGLMENHDPGRFDELYKAQDPALRERLGAWSLREVIPRIRAPLYILHGRADPFIPPEESVRLAAAARRRGTGAVRLLILEGFLHVAPGAGARALTWSQAAGVLRFLGFISEVLTAMEGG